MVFKKNFVVSLLFLLLIVFSISLTACSNNNNNGGNIMVAEKGDTVSVDYTGTFEDGEVFDTSEGKQPLTFVLGEGRLIPGFENAVLGMKVGDTKTVTLKPEEAYGERDERLIQVLPKQAFGDNFSFKVGDMIALTDPNSGRQFPAIITNISEDNVTVDLNPPLAGKTLIFKITLVDLKKAGDN